MEGRHRPFGHQIDGSWTDLGGNTFDEVCPPDCSADLTEDMQVNVDDLLLLIGCWSAACGDVNGDGATNVDDLLELLNQFGMECN
ncbi:MAG: hypothetical protein MK101_08330 [Phycisphaerales bacterium]|nr:hypothetical protein [Phycisphaerales bacterium]